MITDYFMITEKSNRLQVIMITDYDYPISDGLTRLCCVILLYGLLFQWNDVWSHKTVILLYGLLFQWNDVWSHQTDEYFF